MSRLLVALVIASVVHAATPAPRLMALLEDGTLVVFRPGDATGRTLEPAGVSRKLIGIDRRPADGKLYGLAGGTDVYRIDPETGAATLVSTLTVPFDGDVRSGVDFTPQLDRLRLLSIDGRNMRVNVDLGATAVDKPLAYAPDDPHFGTRPRITAAGYGNNHAGVATTTLFEIDCGLDILVIQDPANDGVLKTVGPLGVDVPDLAGFDVVSDADGHDYGWAAWGRDLFTIDLKTGRASPAGPVPGASRPVVSLAILDDEPRP
jgi:hypothetical protein